MRPLIKLFYPVTHELINKTNKTRQSILCSDSITKVQTFIRKSLEVLDDMEKDTKKLRKNACQKDIKETFLLHWNKIEIELEILDPVGFKRHNTCKEEVLKIKSVISEGEKKGIKFDKERCSQTIDCFKTKLTKLSL